MPVSTIPLAIMYIIVSLVGFLLLLAGSSDGQILYSAGQTTTKLYYYTKESFFKLPDARALCLKSGYQLATVESAEEQAVINQLALRKTTTDEYYWPMYWMDMTDKDQNGQWRWNSSGKPVSYTSWAPGYPKSSVVTSDPKESLGCVFMDAPRYNGSWSQTYCSGAYKALCMKDLTPPTTTVPPTTTPTTPTTTKAPSISDLELIGNVTDGGRVSTFYANDQQLTWSQAKDYCAVRGLQLASIRSLEESRLFEGWATRMWKSASGYIVWTSGSNKEVNGNWQWTDYDTYIPQPYSNIGYENWVYGNPWSGSNNPLGCVATRLIPDTSAGSTRAWQSASCTLRYRPLCSLRTVPTVPTTTTTPAPTTRGPTTWIEVGKSGNRTFYTFTQRSMNWATARDYCAFNGLQLANLTESEITIVNNARRTTSVTWELWVWDVNYGTNYAACPYLGLYNAKIATYRCDYGMGPLCETSSPLGAPVANAPPPATLPPSSTTPAPTTTTRATTTTLATTTTPTTMRTTTMTTTTTTTAIPIPTSHICLPQGVGLDGYTCRYGSCTYQETQITYFRYSEGPAAYNTTIRLVNMCCGDESQKVCARGGSNGDSANPISSMGTCRIFHQLDATRYPGACRYSACASNETLFPEVDYRKIPRNMAPTYSINTDSCPNGGVCCIFNDQLPQGSRALSRQL